MSIAVAPEDRLQTTAFDLQHVLDLYQRGLYMQAYTASEKFGPLKDWTGTAARVLAGRMAGCLGGVKLGGWHFVKAYRGDPADADACWFFVRHVLETRGPLPALRMVRKIGEPPDATRLQRAQWLAQHAAILGRVRDFGLADKLMKEALDLGPDHPWIYCELSGLLITEDRLQDALAAERRALELRPWYRPALNGMAHLLVQLERDREALDLLNEACQWLESSHLWAQLAFLQNELRQYDQARTSLEEFARLSPLLEKEAIKWLEARRSDAAYFCGDFPTAVEYAKKAQSPFFEQIAKRLAEPLFQDKGTGKRVHWPVPFVRQHHNTCVPATLAAIARYWSMPGDHLEVAADICYDGTPHHSERRWAEDRGWEVREFTVTWASAMALLDRGVPFTLTTQDPGNAHLQAVMGYDSIRGTLLIRDPGERHQSEFMAEAFFDRYRPTGPRGLALVPREKADLLNGLDLPDTAMYDQMHRLQRALHVHKREEAEQTLQGMSANHYLTWLARRSLAQYDADVPEALACAEGMLALFPSDISWQLVKVACLRQLGQREEIVAILKELAERKPTDPLCWQQYAQELSVDAREHTTALRWLRLALRVNPANAGAYCTLARIRWDQRRIEEAQELDRIAACLADKDEGLAQNYFNVSRCLGRTDDGLNFLRERFARLGAQSSLSGRTLTWGYGQLDRVNEALEVLDKAIALRPNDGDLLVYAGEVQAQFGRYEKARELMTRADGKSQRNGWLRASANMAANQGDRPTALALWRQLLDIDPLNLEAHRNVSQLLNETTGRTAALEHLKQTCARFPHNLPLHQLWIEWLRDEGPQEVEPIVRKLIASHGADVWARRELALTLANQERLPEAFAEMDVAERLEPHSASTWSVRARLLYLSGKLAEANDANRQAIRFSVDHDIAIRELFAGCDTLAERREALAFVENELLKQVTFGNGLLTYRELALYALEPEELLTTLQKALKARPDLWHAWSAVIRQLIDMDRVDDALVLARQAVERFPLLPGMWLDLAAVHRRAKETDGEIDVLQSALQINPGWGPALCALAEVYQIKGELDKAREVLERAVFRAPLSAVNHGALADVLWKAEAREEALDQIQQALRLDPGYEWGWGHLSDWARKMERFDMPVKVARDLTQRRPGEARSWLMLTRVLMEPEPPRDQPNERPEVSRSEERLAAVNRTIELNPRLGDAYDLKAEILAMEQRFDEALAACRPAIWGDKSPLQLRARAAWVVAQQGNLAEAIAQMKGVLAEDANYYWAWTQLADWCQATSALPDYLKAADNLVRLAPHAPVPYGYRGEARIRLGQFAEGKADLRRAFEMSPEYGFAGMLLFDRQLADNELDDAQATLKTLLEKVGGAYADARAVQLAGVRKDEAAAKEALARLCKSPEANLWPFETAVNAMHRAGWSQAVDDVFRAAAQEGAISANAVDLWAQNCAGQDAINERVRAIDRVLERTPNDFRLCDIKADLLARAGRFSEAIAACNPEGQEVPTFLLGRKAWITYQRGDFAEGIEQMRGLLVKEPTYQWGWQQLLNWHVAAKRFHEMFADADRLAGSGGPAVEVLPELASALARAKEMKLVMELASRYRSIVRSTTKAWGKVSAAIGSQRNDAPQVEWMSDWAERKDAEPWMLVNLAISLRGLGRDEEARQVGHAALNLPADITTPFHHVWLALDAVLAGDSKTLAVHLSRFKPEELDPLHVFVMALVDAVKSLQETPAGQRAEVWGEERSRLATLAKELEPVIIERALVGAYRTCVRKMAELRGGLMAKVWAMWRCWLPLLPRATE